MYLMAYCFCSKIFHYFGVFSSDLCGTYKYAIVLWANSCEVQSI